MSAARSGLSLVLLVTLAFVALLTMVNRMETRHGGDEALYTDAALLLRANGDYLTPRTSDGAPRFNKPVLSYWVIDGGLRTFGVNYVAARTGFVLAVAITLVLTWLLGRTLFGSDSGGVVAAAILAGNHNAVYAAERAVPDGLLTLFVTAALLGFSHLLFSPQRNEAGTSRRARSLGWAGSGLAVATKGLLGFGVAFYSLAFARWYRVRLRPPALHGAGAVFLGLALALGWFVAVTFRHGDAPLKSFLFDQVGARVTGGAAGVVGNLLAHVPANLLTVTTDFLPWTVVAVALALVERQRARAFFAGHREGALFVAGWCALLVLIFAAGPVTRARYLLPLYPPLAALAGAFITTLVAGERGRRMGRRLGRTGLALAVLLGLVVVAGGSRVSPSLALTGAAMLFATAVLAWVGHRHWPGPAVATGVWMLMALTVYDGPIRGAFTETPGRTMVAQLATTRAREIVALDVPQDVLAQVHLYSRGQVWPQRLPADTPAGDSRLVGADAILVSGPRALELAAAGYRLDPAGHANRRFPAADVWELIRHGDREAVFSRQRIPYFIATPPR